MLVPDGSIYFWMFSQGLKHMSLDDILAACRVHGKDVRDKDIQNYWNGYYKSDLYIGERRHSILKFKEPAENDGFLTRRYEEYEPHPYLGMPEIDRRFVPCNAANKPMIKWGDGCLSRVDATSYSGAIYLGENLKGCKFIVIDIDADHGGEIDFETMEFGYKFWKTTHVMFKPKTVIAYKGYERMLEYAGIYPSFHLTFKVDKVIPTMHFPVAKIDIVGNEKNSLRYFKNKVWNAVQPADMTPEIWESLKDYIRKRGEQCG